MPAQAVKFASAALAAALLAPLSAHAFDCEKATQPTEKAICANDRIKHRDDLMEYAYFALRRQEGADRAALRRSQLAWLKERSACNGDECLYKSTDARLRRLSERLERHIFALGPGVETVIRNAYPSTIDAFPGCRLFQRNEIAYCMRPYLTQTVQLPDGTKELFVVYTGLTSHPKEGELGLGAHIDPGLVGLFVFKGGPGAWTLRAFDPAAEAGVYGQTFLPLKLEQVGPRTWSVAGTGGNLHSGYDSSWRFHIFPQGAKVTQTTLMVESDNEGAIPPCEDEKTEQCKSQRTSLRAKTQLLRNGQTVAGIWPYRVTVEGTEKGRPYGPRTFTLPWDNKNSEWKTPEDFPL